MFTHKVSTQKIATLFGIAGPLVFITAWAILGFHLHNYSPRTEPISEIARVGRSTHTAMTSALVFFSVSSFIYAWALRSAAKRAALTMVTHGIGGLGVAAIPLGKFSSDVPHEVFAAVVYIAIAMFPLFATFPNGTARDARRKKLAMVAYAVSSIALLISTFGPTATFGLLQRVGLTIGDLWMIWSAIHLLTSADVWGTTT